MHAAIVDRGTWDRTQALANHLQGQRRTAPAAKPSLLSGLIVDEAGEPLAATHACKGKVRYRYYVSRALQRGAPVDASAAIRMPAREIEAAVTGRLAEALNDPLSLAAQAWLVIAPGEMSQIAARSAAAAIAMGNKDREMVRLLVQKVRLLNGRIEIDIGSRALADLLHVPLAARAPAAVTIACELRLTRTGRTLRLINTSGAGVGDATYDPALVKLVAKGRSWWRELRAGETDVPHSRCARA